jgi:hypothetical protein
MTYDTNMWRIFWTWKIKKIGDLDIGFWEFVEKFLRLFKGL